MKVFTVKLTADYRSNYQDIYAYRRTRIAHTTLLYIQIEQALSKEANNEFNVMTVKTPEEIKTLLGVGSEYVCQKDDLLFFRKRK